MIELKNVCYAYGNEIALRYINLNIQKGESVIIQGPNGCGKSTILKTIARILKAKSGDIYINSKNINEQSSKEIARNMAVLPQSPQAPGGLTVEELIAYGRFPHQSGFKNNKQEDKEIVDWALKATGISEFRYRNPIIDEKTLCIFVSQSGETADTLAALRLSKSHGARTLAISNVIGSTITREADYTIYTHAGPEIAVASTKAYTSQVCLIAMLGIYFAELLGSYSKDELEKLKADILDLPSKIEAVLDNSKEIKTFASKVYTQKDMFFLGRGTDYNVALEGSLKLKEISYIHSEAYAAGELKHGPIALIENGVTVIGIITNKELVEKTISNMQEVITRGAKTLIITNQILPNNNFGYVINIPETNELISPILSVIPLQLLSYYISKNKGLDVDKPRNLAKSVTVE